MRRLFTIWCLASVLGVVAPALVEHVTAQAARPAGATAVCGDGTYSKAKTQQGACSRHGGVSTWLGGEKKSRRDDAEHDAERENFLAIDRVATAAGAARHDRIHGGINGGINEGGDAAHGARAERRG